MSKWVGLLDCNNFFVSCERLFRPDLCGKPVIVLSSNDGCVVARSQEVKDLGVPMGVPYFKIKDIIKDNNITVFSSNLTLYRDISRRVFDTVAGNIETVEQYSIDEAFFVLDGSPEEVLNKAKFLKNQIIKETGIPVSVGVAQSKTLAKLAASKAKKTDGVCILPPTVWQEMQETTMLKDIWGVGVKTAKHFQSHGLIFAARFLELPRGVVDQLFGVQGVRLWQELWGIPSTPVSRLVHSKQSIRHTRSFPVTITDILDLKDAIAYHLSEATEDMRTLGLKTKYLQVILGTSRHGDYVLQGGTQAAVFDTPLDDTRTLLKAALALVDTLYAPGVPYKKAGVLLSDFVSKEVKQESLFSTTEESFVQLLDPIMDSLNQKLGKGTVRLGRFKRDPHWTAAKRLSSPAFTTSWGDIPVAKA